jgi:hypothetical protein
MAFCKIGWHFTIPRWHKPQIVPLLHIVLAAFPADWIHQYRETGGFCWTACDAFVSIDFTVFIFAFSGRLFFLVSRGNPFLDKSLRGACFFLLPHLVQYPFLRISSFPFYFFINRPRRQSYWLKSILSFDGRQNKGDDIAWG